MSNQLLPTSVDCCRDPCRETLTTTVPGPQGDAGAAGTNGTDGENAYTETTAGFTVPAEGDTVIVAVENSDWMVESVNADGLIYIQSAGTFQVVDTPDSTHVEIKNIADVANDIYPDNNTGAVIVATGLRVSPTGIQGPAGATPGDALLAANNLNDVDDVATSRSNLGLGTMATQNANAVAITGGAITGITDLAVADGGTGASTAANARTNLGLVIGTNVQAQDATLQSLAALGTVADRIAYTTGIDTWAETALTSVARNLLDDTTVLAQRATLAVLPGYGLLGYIDALDLNSANTDTAFSINSARYKIDRITLENPSAAVTTATAGLFTAAGGGGTTLCADQALSGSLTATTKIMDLVEQAIVDTDARTEGTLYLRVGTAEGAARTVNVRLYGWAYDKT